MDPFDKKKPSGAENRKRKREKDAAAAAASQNISKFLKTGELVNVFVWNWSHSLIVVVVTQPIDCK